MEIRKNEALNPAELAELALAVGRFWADADRLGRLLAGSAAHWSAWREGRLIAFASAALDGGIMSYVQHFWVHPEHQRTGLGRAILERITNELTAAGYMAIGLFADEESAGFYRRAGFSAAADQGYSGLLINLAERGTENE